MGWAPPKRWSAWPLAPEDVPREEEIVGEVNSDDLYTLRMMGEDEPSQELEELLVAITVREAKKRFEGREEESEDGNEGDVPEQATGYNEDGGHGPVPEGHSEILESEKWLRPIVSADDERSADLLRPSIRHTLSKLDELLMALHHAREACHRITSRSTTKIDNETVQEEGSPTERLTGRPRKFANLALLQKEEEAAAASDATEPFRVKKTHIGRPQKVYPRIEGESQQDYLIRIARIQKKALPSFAAPRPILPPRSPSAASSRARKSPIRRSSSEELKVSRQKRLALRDWSEVLGSAALIGFPQNVITRATQRCADLFGEGMTMLTMAETSFKKRDTNFFATYLPKEIPEYEDETESSEGESNESEGLLRSSKRKARDALETDSWYCPLEACRRMNRAGFEFRFELRRHIAQVHGLEKDEIDEMLDDEVMDGAVHNDGFLEPMRYRRGVRGKGKAPRKRSKKASDSADVSTPEQDETQEGEQGSSSSGLGDEDAVDGHRDEQHHPDFS